MYSWFVAICESVLIQFFVAGPVPPGPAVAGVAGSVSRVSTRPPTDTVVVALIVVVPAVFDVI